MKRGYTIDDDLRELVLSLLDRSDSLGAAKILEDALEFQDPSARPAVENLLRARGLTPPRARDEAAP